MTILLLILGIYVRILKGIILIKTLNSLNFKGLIPIIPINLLLIEKKKKRVVSPPNQSPETDPNLEGDGVLNCFGEKSSRLRLRKCEGI